MASPDFFKDYVPPKKEHKKAKVSKKSSTPDFFGDLPEEPSRARSLISAPIKGALRGVKNIGELAQLPTNYLYSKIFPEAARREKEGLDEGWRSIEENVLPTRKGEVAEDVLESAGEFLPAAALSGASIPMKLLQSLAAGAGKEGLKAVDVPEWAADIGGAFTSAIPGAVKNIGQKAVSPSKSQKEMYDYLKKKGLSEESITPIIQNETKKDLLGPLAAKGGRSTKIAQDIRKNLGPIYEDIKKKGSTAFLSNKDSVQFESKLLDKLDDLHYSYRKSIDKDVKRLLNNPVSFKSLREFEREVNNKIGNLEGGKAELGILKDVTSEFKKKIDKELFKDLEMVNGAYRKGLSIADRLDPKGIEGLMPLGSVGHKIYSIATLAKVLGGRSIAREMLTNPRLQNLHRKLLKSINDQKYSVAVKLAESIEEEMKSRD